MIQDFEAIYANEYQYDEPKLVDFVMFVKGRSVLMQKDCEEINYLTVEELKKHVDDVNSYIGHYLFAIMCDGVKRQFFLGEASKLPESVFDSYSFENHNVFRRSLPKCRAFAGVTASQLANWYEHTRFCSHCGALLDHDDKERMLKCPNCNDLHYPKISPAVIVAVTNGDKLLLTKYAGRDYTNYALIAGFVEIGESIERTVEREVMEEVGLKVKNIRYYKSQPWSFSDTVLMGFYCEVDGDTQISLDTVELSVGEWISREDILVEFDDISLTNEMIIRFKEGKE